MSRDNKKFLSVLIISIICGLSFCCTRNVEAVGSTDYRIISSKKNNYIGQNYTENSQYEYDKYGNKIEFSTPASFDAARIKVSNSMAAPVYHFVFWTDGPSRSPENKIVYYDYNNNVVYSHYCGKYDFAECKKKFPLIFESKIDKNGIKTDTYYTSSNNGNITDNISALKMYRYNSKGQKIEEMFFNTSSTNLCAYKKTSLLSENTPLGENIHYYYDSKSNLVISEYVRTFCKKLEYDNKQQKNVENFLEFNHYTKYKYDKNNNLVSKDMECDKNFANCKSSTKYVYNSSGKLIKKQVNLYNYIDNIIEPSWYEYDLRKNVIRQSLSHYKKKMIYDNEKYEYDEQNNITKAFYCSDNWQDCSKNYQIQYKYSK